MTENCILLKLTGRGLQPELPALLSPAKRSANEPADEFLPPGYLTPVASFDVSAAARSGTGGAEEIVHRAEAGEVLVIELADGGSFITTAAELKASLALTRPDLIVDGEIQFEKLRAESAGAHRGFGEAVGGLVSRVFALLAGGAPDEIVKAARARLGDAAGLGITWAGTKALMWVIEDRLYRKTGRPPGLYRWSGATGSSHELEPVAFERAADEAEPMLVFVHGTASSTLGSFGDLRIGDANVWNALEGRYTGGILAFEHRTLSESPIENALQLARALPSRSRISLVSHSRGGLVADLLCIKDFDALIEAYRAFLPGTGETDPAEAERVLSARETAHAEHRGQLRELAEVLREKQIVVQRYVRTASPANGTLLAGGNFDIFLSGLLTLIGAVPMFFGSPYYAAFKRAVLEIVKNRTNPHMVPGIEAMLPDSPLARLLRDAPVQDGIEMAVVAGDIEEGGLLQRFGVLLTDFLIFENVDHDLVVDTAAMLTGIAPRAGARVLFDRGSHVSHFRYFSNFDTRTAVRDWLTAGQVVEIPAFQPLPGRFGDMEVADERQSLEYIRTARGLAMADRPVVVVLPGAMGSHLWVGRRDRVWFDPADIASGGLDKLAWDRPDVEAEALLRMVYGPICEHLSESHRVELFPYDWRQPLDLLGERLGGFLEGLLGETSQPVRLLAHSMGGLLVRACIYRRRALMDQLMGRDGARLIMLGTPNQGAHSMVENLLGMGSTVRALAALDVKHSLPQLLDTIAGFRGLLQLLPKPGFMDVFQGAPDGGGMFDFQKAATWAEFKNQARDRWFGDHICATPAQGALDAASWLWVQDGGETPELPASYESRSVYIFGLAGNTPCGVREQDGRLRLVGTTSGDGTVTWESGRIGNIGRYYYMPEEHGDLPAAKEHFPALTDLLLNGSTSQLATSPPSVRAIQQARPIVYDAGPPALPSDETLVRGLVGGSRRSGAASSLQKRMAVSVKAMDLRFLRQPLLVGHYEQDPIAGPESLIDRIFLDGELSQRYGLGLYAGPQGTAVVVLRAGSARERSSDNLVGAVVTGLGVYDGALSLTDVTAAVRVGVLRYLLHIVDVLGRQDRTVPLAAVLLGYNSSASLSVGASVEALVRGVIEANHRFAETTGLRIRVDCLDIVELYQDTAISAVYELRRVRDKLDGILRRTGTRLVCGTELEYGEGWRPRLFDHGSQSYWPRILVTAAGRGRTERAGYRGEDSAPVGADAASRKSAKSGRVVLANRLRYLYVGQRARAESVVQQRQPGLIETLIRQQIHTGRWQEDLGRMLFQLMVPHDFKDATCRLERLVLVVDAYTANLPWELMMGEGAGQNGEDRHPLSVRVPMVRQLVSTEFRRYVRQSVDRAALVIGNPSIEGFAAAFPGAGNPQADIPALPSAEEEANAIASLLAGMAYRVVTAIGEECQATDVLAKLYRQPYRILHISAHGIFDVLHADGLRRSGVVLSHGLLITAREIQAMDVVPELVFLNCCHLGQVDRAGNNYDDRTVRDGNKLAASVARELIAIGVRCVVVAGWAVTDERAKQFGEAFYRNLMLRGRAFGDAVHQARKMLWDNGPEDITWGAFQAYGDPVWSPEPGAAGNEGGFSAPDFASPEELFDELARVRTELSRKRARPTEREARDHIRALDELLKKRCPAAWLALPGLRSALGATWNALGCLERARDAYLLAIRGEHGTGRVPIRDIELLADVEARLGEMTGDVEMIDRAVERLDQLDAVVAVEPQGKMAAPQRNGERCALRGNACEGKARLQARRVVECGDKHLCDGMAVEDAAAVKARENLQKSLADAVEAYREGEGVPGDAGFNLQSAMSRLALDALTPWPRDAQDREAAVGAAVALATYCQQVGAQQFSRSGSFLDAVMQPQALLVIHLLRGELRRSPEVALLEIAQAYEKVLSNLMAAPTELDSVVSRLNGLAIFCDALFVIEGDPGRNQEADALLELVQRIQPGARIPARRPSPEPSVPGKPSLDAAAAGRGRRPRSRKSRGNKPAT